MGKEKKGKRHRNKKPAGLPPTPKSVAEADEDPGEAEANGSGTITEMALSDKASNRGTACATYTMIFEGMADRSAKQQGKRSNEQLKDDKVALRRLIEAGAPGVLAGLLTADPDPAVRAKAAQALCAMAADIRSPKAPRTTQNIALTPREENCSCFFRCFFPWGLPLDFD